MATKVEEFKPGDKVRASGIYDVIHDKLDGDDHAQGDRSAEGLQRGRARGAAGVCLALGQRSPFNISIQLQRSSNGNVGDYPVVARNSACRFRKLISGYKSACGKPAKTSSKAVSRPARRNGEGAGFISALPTVQELWSGACGPGDWHHAPRETVFASRSAAAAISRSMPPKIQRWMGKSAYQ